MPLLKRIAILIVWFHIPFTVDGFLAFDGIDYIHGDSDLLLGRFSVCDTITDNVFQ